MKKFIDNFQTLDCSDILLMLDDNKPSIKITKNDKFDR